MKISFLSFLLASIVSSQAAIVYDESVSGDLSGVGATPTVIVANLGSNTIIGQIGNNGNTGATNGNDADYFLVGVSAGWEIIDFTVDSYTFAPNNPNLSFFGHKAGSGFAGQAAGDIDGDTLFNASSGDLLPDFAGANLAAGDHSFWVQETSPNTVDYQFSFTVIPEPSSLWLGLLGAGACLVRRRRS